MTTELFALMQLQGDIKVMLINRGIDPELAHDLSGECFHIFITSDIAKETYRAVYDSLLDETAREG